MGKATNLSRRNFLKVSATASGGWVLGFYFPGLQQQPSGQERVFAPNIGFVSLRTIPLRSS